MIWKRQAAMPAAFILMAILLAGCFGSPRTETIIIPDEEAPAGDAQDPFAVKTIYRLLEDDPSLDKPLGWLNKEDVLSLYRDRDRGPALERVNEPYESRLRLRDADNFPELARLSPDGRYITSIDRKENGDYSLKLVSLTDRTETAVAAFNGGMVRTVQLAWSSNGRFLAFAGRKPDGSARFDVFEPASGELRSYFLPEWQRTDTLSSIYIADDAQSAAIVKVSAGPSAAESSITGPSAAESSIAGSSAVVPSAGPSAGSSGTDSPSVVLGALSGTAFAPEYEHSAKNDTIVEWIHPYQIAFAGTDGSLYAYDSRNGALAVLLEKVGLFRLSPDKAYIAYSRDGEGDAVYAAVLHGNNVLDEKQIYRGVSLEQLIWSPDGGRLLLSGWKPYERSQPAAVQKEADKLGVTPTQNLIIEFQ